MIKTNVRKYLYASFFPFGVIGTLWLGSSAILADEVEEPVVEETETTHEGWNDDQSSYYINNEKVTGFQTIDNSQYYFNDEGVKQVGQKKIDNYWYVFDKDTGSMKTGLVYLSTDYTGEQYAKTSYYNDEGRMQYKEKKINGSWYVFDKYSGAMKTGLFFLDNDYTNSIYTKTAYYSNDGKMQYKEQKINGSWHVFDKYSGAMKTGLFFLDRDYTNASYTKTSYYNSEGKMQYRQQKISGYWYCFDKYSGAMKTGITFLDRDYTNSNYTKYSYYNSEGKMQYGQQKINGDWYCFDLASGAMKTGFVYLDRSYEPSGAKTVYYDSKGRMVHTNFKQNGIQYIVNPASGKVTRQFNPTYYSQLDGRWSGRMYNGATLGATGCVSSSIAMAINGIMNNGLTPVGVADYLYYNTNEFNKMEYGASGLAIATAAKHWSVSSNPIGSLNAYKNALSEGQIVVFLVGPGNFTAPGSTHAIVTFQNSNGSTYAYDPYNSGNNGWYSVNSIWNQKSTHPYDLRGGYIAYGLYKNI